MPLSRRALLAGAAFSPLAAEFAVRSADAAPSVLRYGLFLYPPSFDPWEDTGTAAAEVNACIRRSLLSYTDDGKLRGELAEHWEANGETWTFKLRKAYFHNGDQVKAADVKWSVERMAAPKSTAYLAGRMRSITSIETPDDMTVRLITKQPVVTLPFWFAMPQAPIISHGAGKTGADAVGAGPFVITQNARGVRVRLKKFPKFYRPGLPKLDGIDMTVYADENLRVSALRAGTVDMIDYVPWESMATVAADKKLKMDSTFGPFMYLMFNGARGRFKDVRVRQAVALAVKREDVVKAAFYGFAKPLYGLPIREDGPFYDAKLAHYWSYDPARAKKLLAEAGFPNGFSCTLLSNITNRMHMATAEVVQQNLAAIGIKVKLALPEWAQFVALAGRGQYEFAVMGAALDYNDPDGLTPFIDGSLPGTYARSWDLPTPRITKLLPEGRSEMNAAKRKLIYDKVQQAALEQVPACFLVWRSQAYAMKKNVHGFVNLPGQLTFDSGYTLEDTYIA